VGETAQFSVATTVGTPPFTYQWQFNGIGMTNGVYVSGVTTPSLTLNEVTLGEAGSYQVVVINAYGSITSSNATLTVLPAPSGRLVGHWLVGATNYADVSGYRPAGTHDGFLVGSTNAWFTNDVPPIATGGQSLCFPIVITSTYTNADTGLAISNSSTLETNYVDTFDDDITNEFTVMFWAKGAPAAWSWNPWVSKYGDGGQGWQLRTGGANGNNNGGPVPCWTVRGNEGSGILTLGAGPSWSATGDQEDLHAAFSGVGSEVVYYGCDNDWHCYAGTFDGLLGTRNLYIDGTLRAQVVNVGAYTLSPSSYLMIGGKDSGGDVFGNFENFEIYDVRIYNDVLTQSAVRNASGLKPSLNMNLSGANTVLNWSWGTLLGATNLTGPWLPVSTTTPYTNSMTDRQHFFRVSNP
jgi:hypothetical protein